ncbi:MAG: hypothetical protein WA130_13000 [Candidatus Methanoperedens sp.]
MSKTQLIIKNFFIKTEQNKREIIFWAIITFIITFLLSHYLFEPGINYIDDQFSPKPIILSNVLALNNVENSNIKVLNENLSEYNATLENVSIYLSLGNPSTLIYVLDSEKLKDDYKRIEFVTFDKKLCTGCTIYNFLVMNKGNKRADKVIIDIKTSSESVVLYDNPKMVRKECGGYLEQKGCYIIIETINEGEEVGFGLFTKELSNLMITSCIVDGKYPCDIRLLRTKITQINTQTDVLFLADEKVDFPIFENLSSTNNIYYFNFSQFKFIKVEVPSERLERK